MRKRKNIVIIILIILIIVVAFIAVMVIRRKASMEKIFGKIENINAYLTEYIVYGPHLNIKGEIRENIYNVKEVNLIFVDFEGKEEKLALNYQETEKGVEFYTSDLINEGIDLEGLGIGNNYCLIEVKYGKRDTKLYSIENKTEYDDIMYYTITKNNSNRKVEIKFETYKTEVNNIKYMLIEVKSAKLPKEVYDIVIDPGHGGSDNGAEYGGYSEADLTLDFAKEVKTELEKLGLKVKITRNGTEDKEKFGTQTVYDKNGRVNIVGESKAKYVFSIHLNSIQEPNSQSGVEIYAPPKLNLKFAKSFADNIVKYADTTYSTLEASYKKDDGVYVRTFKDWEIVQSVQDAKRAGYEPYNITEETPYLYMLRETGGIATGAYVDGRNKGYGQNMYYNSNVGVESYLLELGYINNDENLKRILSNKDGYIKGIIETIKQKIT